VEGGQAQPAHSLKEESKGGPGAPTEPTTQQRTADEQKALERRRKEKREREEAEDRPPPRPKPGEETSPPDKDTGKEKKDDS
jgi:hypothetical protein